MSESAPRAIVYIDGWSLYYSIRTTPYRWLDPLALSRRLFPELRIQRVKYFTAIGNRPEDPQARARQETYLRALRTLKPKLKIYAGSMSRHKGAVPLALEKDSRWRRRLLALAVGDKRILTQAVPRVQVWKTEEKGSDVNLASHLIADAYEENFDVAAVLTNDMDLEHPLRFVREKLGRPVILFNAAGYRHERLAPADTPGSSYVRIKGKALSACQFPELMSDARGQFRRPQDWDGCKKS